MTHQVPAPPPLPTCPRHAGRVATRACTRCTRPWCGHCLTPMAVGSHCPDCIRAARPPLRTRLADRRAAQPVLLTKVLMAVNIAVFLWVVADQGRAVSTVGVVSRRQVDLGLTEGFLVDGQWYRLVSSGFLHFGVFHLLMNMLLLFQLGNMLEPALGHLRFGLTYLAALLGGSAGAMVLQPSGLHGGASGAVFGLMAAAAVGLQQRGVNPFRTGIGTVLALNLLITFTIPGISIGGHLGGALAGAACALFVLDPSRRHPAWWGVTAPVIVSLVAVMIPVVIVS